MSELEIASESGSKDLMDMLDYLYKYEQDKHVGTRFSFTKRDFYEFSSKKLGDSAEDAELKGS